MLTLGARPLSLDLLMQDYSGHLFPGGFLFAWCTPTSRRLDWGVAVVEIVALQLVASVARVAGPLPAAAGFLVAAAGAVGLPVLPAGAVARPSGGRWPSSTSRLASSCSSRPGRCCIGCRRAAAGPAPWSCWRPRRASCSRSAPSCTPWCSASWPSRSPRRSACAGSSWRSGATSWCGCPSSALIVGYVVAHRELAPIDSASPGSAAASAELVGNFLARNAVPGFVGGPWTDPGPSTIVVPTTWAVALGWTVLVVVVALTLYRSRSAVWGWLLLLVYTLVDAVLLFGGRTGPDFGEALGLIPRYSADIVPVLVVALGLVARAADVRSPRFAEARRRGHRGDGRSRRQWPWPLLASAAISTSVVAPHSYNEDDRAYVEGLRADLRADPAGGRLRRRAPRQRHGVVVRRRRPGLDRGRHRAGGPGLRPAHATPCGWSTRRGGCAPSTSSAPWPTSRPRTATCGHRGHRRRVSPGSAWPEPTGSGKQVARISYYTSAAGFLVVSTAGGVASLPLRQDLNVADVVVDGPIDELELRLEGPPDAPADATVCVVGVLVGFPTPG